MNNKLILLTQFFKRNTLSVFMVSGLLLSASTRAQLPTAIQISGKMTVGCNLGNTLEAICGELVWGAGKTSQKLIDSIKAAGFNSIRVPCAWFCHSDTITNIIDSTWIARVKEVVNYCINDSLYTILNIHWDNGWLDHHINTTDSARVNARLRAYWTQIAAYFRDYNEHLIFAGANEPPAKDSAQMSILLSYYQTFIDAVRATGGNNSSRTLIIQGPSTDIALTNILMKDMPTDFIENRLMVEVHYYTPYQFCLMESDHSWGKMFYYWGKGNHSATDTIRNATWGEESEMDINLGLMKTNFVDKGIPVIIGEYGAYRRKLSFPSDQALNNASVEYYHRYFVKTARNIGIIPFLWDTPGGLFDRNTGSVRDKRVLAAIMQRHYDETKNYEILKK
ncbi:MAG: glycoside hydrolase family 5 protein [Calditrichaceae bacterium]|nr:glycoside hydrolase family 5 protein [Calditrichaceae bacterium]MBN2708136.1 glycoside hydrolase family 5 protein [Calditrichaceae bacterium]